MDPKMEPLSIPGYYAGKTIFLTGGTGFLGKVIVEKLLRSCPDIAKIFLIIRPMKNVAPQDRWNQLCELKLFDRLKKERPDALKKIVVIPGDINEDNFNISPENLELINNEVNVIMHGAASINFGDEILSSLKQNTESTYRMAEMALKIDNLESFIYVSTAYSNCEKELIGLKERIYEEKSINWRHILEAANDKETFIGITEKLVGRHPVRYTFTKMLGELVVQEYSVHYPVVIVRPSVVLPTFEEPFPYWADALNGMTAVCMCVALAILRIVLCDRHALLEYVPADWSSRAIISSAWDVANRKSKNGCAIFCVTYGDRLKLSTDLMYTTFMKRYESMITVNQLWHAFLFMTKSVLWYRIISLFIHIIPALIVDTFLRITGKEPRLIKIYKKITFLMVNKSAYFTLKTFRFDFSRLKKMEESFVPEDVPVFGTTHIETVDAENIIENCSKSATEYVFKADMSSEAVERRRRKSIILKYVHYTLCSVVAGLIVWAFL